MAGFFADLWGTDGWVLQKCWTGMQVSALNIIVTLTLSKLQKNYLFNQVWVKQNSLIQFKIIISIYNQYIYKYSIFLLFNL